jgi:hypothetical protein
MRNQKPLFFPKVYISVNRDICSEILEIEQESIRIILETSLYKKDNSKKEVFSKVGVSFDSL